MSSTIILGAGMAGLTCARRLVDAGRQVQLYDKARGPSGRMASRRSEAGTFDHGAPLFRVNHPDFQTAVDEWIEAGQVAPWSPRWSGNPELAKATWYTALPRMSALLRHVSQGIDCHWQQRAVDLQRDGDEWVVDFESGASARAEQLVCALPAPQTADLLRSAQLDLAEEVAAIPFHGTWAGLFAFADPLPVDWDIHRGGDGPLHTIVRDGQKLGRDAGERVVVHALDSWSDAHIDESFETMLPALREELRQFIGTDLPAETFAQAHRWRYAHAAEPWGRECHWADGLGIVGDWCLGAGVGAAWGSGAALAGRLLA